MTEIRNFGIAGGLFHGGLFITIMILAFFDIKLGITGMISSILWMKAGSILGVLASGMQGFLLGFSVYLGIGSAFHLIDKA